MRAPIRASVATETVTIADLDTVPACFKCGAPATWTGCYQTCRHAHLWCADCRAVAIGLARKARQSAAPHIHHCCGTENPDGIRWQEL